MSETTPDNKSRPRSRMQLHLARHRTSWLRSLVVLVLIGLVYLLGWIQGVDHARQTDISISALQRDIEALTERLDEAEKGRVEAELAGQIGQAALDDLRLQLVEWRQAEARLQQEVSFYRSLIEPDAVANVINIDNFLLLPAAEPRVFRFEVLVVQRGRDQERFAGHLQIRLFGMVNGEPLALDSGDLLLEERDMKLDFLYFQRLNGTLRLPEGFEPLEALAAVYPDGSDTALVEKPINWPKVDNPDSPDQ